MTKKFNKIFESFILDYTRNLDAAEEDIMRANSEVEGTPKIGDTIRVEYCTNKSPAVTDKKDSAIRYTVKKISGKDNNKLTLVNTFKNFDTEPDDNKPKETVQTLSIDLKELDENALIKMEDTVWFLHYINKDDVTPNFKEPIEDPNLNKQKDIKTK